MGEALVLGKSRYHPPAREKKAKSRRSTAKGILPPGFPEGAGLMDWGDSEGCRRLVEKSPQAERAKPTKGIAKRDAIVTQHSSDLRRKKGSSGTLLIHRFKEFSIRFRGFEARPDVAGTFFCVVLVGSKEDSRFIPPSPSVC